ncbi:MAG: hypothetical protein EPO24_12810 [Bacteroidetes bacterium]|nr:MAG: hypothetical protein EPO24_12810 [Bacteroidota bacterium]
MNRSISKGVVRPHSESVRRLSRLRGRSLERRELFGTFFVLIVLCSMHVYAQGDSTGNQESGKPKIIFKAEPGQHNISPSQIRSDSSKPKIIFQDNAALDSRKIILQSSEYYQMDGQTYPVGEDGVNLKMAMQSNPEAVEKVASAYRKRTTGTVLMVLGGGLAVAGVVVSSTHVTVSEQTSGNTTYSVVWLPLVTAGVIVGGIGYVNHSALGSNLQEAVQLYNDSLTVNGDGSREKTP